MQLKPVNIKALNISNYSINIKIKTNAVKIYSIKPINVTLKPK